MGLLKRLGVVCTRFVREIDVWACYALLATMALGASEALAASGPTASSNGAALPQFLIVDYHPVSKTLVAGSSAAKPLYDYAYRVDIRNGGSAVGGVSASATSTQLQFQIVQPTVQFGPVAALRTQTSIDTFVVRAYCNFDHRLDPKSANGSSFCNPGDDGPDVAGNTRAIDDAASKVFNDILNKTYNNTFSKLFQWQIQVSNGSAPAISSTQPTGAIKQATPTLSASFQDAGSGVSTNSLALIVDGVDVSRQASATTTGFSYTPSVPLKDGAHQVALSIADSTGRTTQATWSFVIDTVAPSITGTVPQDITIANSLAPISAQYSDLGTGINPAAVMFKLDGADVTGQSAVTATGISYTPTAKLANGAHTAAISVADMAGNTANVTWSFKIDRSGPTVTNMQPANGAILAADAIPAVSATIGDGLAQVNASDIKLELDGINVTSQARVSATAVSYTPTTALAEGDHTVKLSVTDQYGNVSVTTWAFVTRTLPEITSVTPKDITLNAQASQTITAQFRDIGAGIDPARITLLLDGVDVTSAAQVTGNGLTFTPASPLSQGVHIATLTVLDKAGNSTSTTWRFTVDTGLPTISGMSPQDTLLTAGMPTISASYQDSGDPAISPGIDTASVKLTVDGVDVTVKSQVTASGITYTPTTALADGLHTIKLTVADKAANTVNTTWSFSTNTATSVGLGDLAPANGSTLPADALPTIGARFQGTAGSIDMAHVTLELDGVDVTSQAQVTTTGITYTPTAVLKEGAHAVRLTVPAKAGTSVVQTWTFSTATPPVITAQNPIDVFLPGGATPVISASYSDVGSGMDTSKTVLQLDGADVTAQATVSASGIQYQVPAALTDGAHTVYLRIADLAGNAADSTWTFGTATAPEITALSPKDTLLSANSRPTISAQYADTRVGIDVASVRLIVNGDDVTAGSQVTATGVSYTPAAPLAAGPYTVYLQVANKTNATANAVWGFEVDVTKTYNVAITSPAGQQTVVVPKMDVVATAQANRTYPVRLTLNGTEMTSAGIDESGLATYRGSADLIDGTNTLTVQATYADGEVRSTSTQVSYDAPPRVTITSPADKAMLGRANTTSPGNLTGNVDRPVTITGRISKPVTTVRINQQAATLSSDGQEFRFDNFFLHEGMNVLTAVATDARGRVGSAAIQVSVDQTAPILTIEAPQANALTSSATIDVRGMVNDAVEAFTGAPEPRVSVTVNGTTKTGQVADRYYLVPNVPLQVGENTLVVSAVDQFGNVRTQELKVSRIAVGSNRLTLLSGSNQSAKSGVELARPLAVVALNAAGEPLVGIPVNFDVVRGTGSISTTQGRATKPNGVTPARNLTVTTDASGRAQVWFAVGKQSGVGANVVKASYPKFAEEVIFTATTERGAVYKVNADLGINQFAETGSQPLELLSVVVRDRDDNPLPNVPVVYTVEEGDAYFTDNLGGVAQDGGKRIVMNTDKNGMTALRPTIGNKPGTIRITARALRDANGSVDNPDDLTGNATYLIQAKQAKDGPASFTGYVYTDKGQPLPGVRVSIGRTLLASTTDAQGRFEFESVPPGRIDLFVDGRTVNPTNDPSQKQWPSLHFESYAVRGQDNQLPHPIYLPPLLVSEAKTVGGNEDVILKIPGLEGFQMKVKANSVTFPDGSHVGTLVVSPVTADRLPMAPPAGGAQFGVPAWTVQPAGTRFDPPIEVTLPNTAGNPPGDNLPIVQWDHDLGQFVPMGRATVSEDGAFLITDSGSGITKAGWGGLCRYDPDKCAKKSPPKCNDCQKIDRSGNCPVCVPDEARDGFAVWSDNGKVAITNESLEPLKKLTGMLGANLGWSGGVNVSWGLDKNCCSKDPSGRANSVNLGLAAELEVSFSIPWSPIIDKVKYLPYTKYIYYYLPQSKVKGAVAGGGKAEYDFCKEEGDANWVLGFTFEVDALSIGKNSVIVGNTPANYQGVELFVFDIGGAITGEYKSSFPKPVIEGGLVYDYEFKAIAFVKGQANTPTLNFTFADLQFVFYQDKQSGKVLSLPFIKRN